MADDGYRGEEESDDDNVLSDWNQNKQNNTTTCYICWTNEDGEPDPETMIRIHPIEPVHTLQTILNTFFTTNSDTTTDDPITITTTSTNLLPFSVDDDGTRSNQMESQPEVSELHPRFRIHINGLSPTLNDWGGSFVELPEGNTGSKILEYTIEPSPEIIFLLLEKETLTKGQVITGPNYPLCIYPRDSLSKWSCTSCTMLNHIDAKKCSICQTDNGNPDNNSSEKKKTLHIMLEKARNMSSKLYEQSNSDLDKTNMEWLLENSEHGENGENGGSPERNKSNDDNQDGFRPINKNQMKTPERQKKVQRNYTHGSDESKRGRNGGSRLFERRKNASPINTGRDFRSVIQPSPALPPSMLFSASNIPPPSMPAWVGDLSGMRDRNWVESESSGSIYPMNNTMNDIIIANDNPTIEVCKPVTGGNAGGNAGGTGGTIGDVEDDTPTTRPSSPTIEARNPSAEMLMGMSGKSYKTCLHVLHKSNNDVNEAAMAFFDPNFVDPFPEEEENEDDVDSKKDDNAKR